MLLGQFKRVSVKAEPKSGRKSSKQQSSRRKSMAPPSLEGDPQIKQVGASVVCEAIAKAGAEPTTKWTKDDKDIQDGAEYKFAVEKAEAGKFRITNTIVSFDKPFAGIYKCSITTNEGTVNATFTVTAGDAPDFPEKPHILQKDGGKILAIKIKATSKTAATAEWLKDDKPVKFDDRVKAVVKADEKKAPKEYIFLLEINGPQTDDQAKYACVVKNADGQNSQSLNLNFD